MNRFPRSPRTNRRLSLLGGSVALLLAGALPVTANAQDPEEKEKVRYNRDSKKTKAKSGLLDTKFEAEKQQAERDQKRVQLMAAAEFAKKREAVEQEMADKQIEFLKRLIKSTEKSDPEYPDLLFRLADHHLEKKAFFELQAGNLYTAIYEAEDSGNKAKVKQLQAQQDKFLREAKDASAKAARVYQALVEDPAFGTYKRMDEALYYYAFELGVLGEEVKMQEAYKRLIQNYPDSAFISQAYLAFADYYYGKGEIQNAVRLYEKVLVYKDSPVYAYALYKLGWCHLNPIGTAEARYDLSLNYFEKTIQATKEGRAGSEAAGAQLRRDTRRDLVRAYVFAAKPTKSWEYFQKWGVGPNKDEDDARLMMSRLANQYFGNGMYTESTYVYKKLQELFPNDEETCDWQAKIVVNTLATDNKQVQWQETALLGKEWERFKDSDHSKAIKRKCRDDALNTMKQMATVWHDEAEKTRLDTTYDLADKAYTDLLRIFPKDKDAYEMQFYYAELLWALAVNSYAQKDKESRDKGLQYFLRSHQQFVKTLELDPKGKYTQDAAFAQMLAMKNYLEYDETGGQSKACKTNSEGVCIYKDKEKKKKPKRDKDSKVDAETDFPESDYTEEESQMLNAYDIYTKYVNDPKDEELPKIMYHRAKLAMIHNKFDAARPLLEEILEKFDGSIYAAWCSEMLVDLLTIKWVDTKNTPEDTIKASDDLELWANKLQKMKVWKHPEAEQIREAVPRLLAGIGWKKGMAYRDAGKAYVDGEPGGDPEGFAKCAEQFIQVYNDFEDHDRADTLLWNAAECSQAAYKVGQAIQIRKILLDNFPESQHATDTLHYLAGSYQAVAYYKEAAERYEEFAEKHKSDKRAPEALQNAYLFRLGLGEEEKAKANIETYENLFKRKDPERAAGIFWSKQALLETDRGRLKHAEEYLKLYGAKGGKDRQAVAEAVVGQVLWRESCSEELLYDSCISIKRKKAVSGADEIRKRRKLEARVAREQAKGKDTSDESGAKAKIPNRCGSATQGVVTVNRRDKAKGAQAQARFDKVLKLAGSGVKIPSDDIQRADAFKNAWGMAMVYQADEKYEEYLKLNMPEELDFTVDDWRKDSGIPAWERKYAEQVKKKEDSVKRFQAFYEKKVKLGKELQEQYAKVKNTSSPYWVLAAAARTAMVQANFADQLYRADVPSSFKTEEQYFAYCDALADQAQPVADQAKEAFTYCIEKSTEYQYFNMFSRLCEEEMQQQDAETYPATNELFGESIYTKSQISSVGVLSDPEGEQLNRVKQKKSSDDGGGEKKDEEEKSEE